MKPTDCIYMIPCNLHVNPCNLQANPCNVQVNAFDCTMCMNELVWPSDTSTAQHIIFPGCGVNMWWQFGAIQALRERFDLKRGKFEFYGASAGSISSVVAACNVDFEAAMAENLKLPEKSDVFTHSRLIELWLDRILPHNCHVICSGKVHISVTVVSLNCPQLRRMIVSSFCSKQDLINACLSSSHIPFLLDGNFTRVYRGKRCVDGSLLFVLKNTFWETRELTDSNNRHAFVFNHRDDQDLIKHNWGSFHKLDKKSLMQMFQMGYSYGKAYSENVTNGN